MKVIVFDWGGVLYDSSINNLVDGTREILGYCSMKYPMYLVSLAKQEVPEARRQKIKAYDLERYFQKVYLPTEDKNTAYTDILALTGVKSKDLVIVDDRTVRGIQL